MIHHSAGGARGVIAQQPAVQRDVPAICDGDHKSAMGRYAGREAPREPA